MLFKRRRQFYVQDLKPANLLISSEGVLKIADFSLSRLLLTEDNDGQRGEHQCYTGQVATRRYRAPELLFGSVRYDQSIDMWSVGCILAEMQMKTPLFAVSPPPPKRNRHFVFHEHLEPYF